MLPLSLYIHMPWCIQKCPYCDFNSHKSPEILPETRYITALIEDLQHDIHRFGGREIHSIFIGGGTPSLFSANAYNTLFNALKQHLHFHDAIEITMEANPGSVEQARFRDYRALGINRLSLGIQSFNAQHLKTLGRVHDDKQAHLAIESARLAGFDNVNLDLMHSLPNQTVQQGLDDLRTALNYAPEHLSWYQLTLEPNTVFYKRRPTLPTEDETCALEEQGLDLLAAQKFQRYEISAFCQPGKASQHNLNYWTFGDYYGIGAGAHGKFTQPQQHTVWRTQKYRQPTDYLNEEKSYLTQEHPLTANDLVFEFMLNASRLQQPILHTLFGERTGLAQEHLLPLLEQAQYKGLIEITPLHWQVTPLGRRYTNDLQALFLP